MRKLFLFVVFAILFDIASFAQDDLNSPHTTAKQFMFSGDYNNAIVILTRALQADDKNLELNKDLAMCYYLKRDYTNALTIVKELIDRNDADVPSFQIAGNVYKALEQVKDCEKAYKKGLKKFPKSGPLYSEYGELLWETKDFSAIQQWEKGIETDPGYSGNYYNASLFYFYAKDKVWSILYGEIFVNMESMGERGAAMKQQLLQAYKEKLYADADLMKGEEGNKSEFAKTFLKAMNKHSTLANNGITTDVLTMIRTRFILDWYENNATKFPFRLFDYQQQLIREGMFEAYNQWLFGTTENLAAFETWTKTHSEAYNGFTAFQRNRIFKMPPGQHYQVN